MRNTEQRVITIIDNNLNRKQMIKSDSILDDFGFDALDYLYILMEIENEFNIQIDDFDWDEIKIVQDIVNLVDKQNL